MKLLRPLAGYTLYDHKTNDSVRRELQAECILDKIDEYRRNWFLHLQRMPNHITTDHKEEEQLEDRKNVGEKSYNSGDGSKGPILDVHVHDDDDDDDDVK